METVRSKDGTTIAFDRLGKGPPLVLVGGSFEHRALESETAKLAVLPLMGEHFTLFHYDRRGRGNSTNTPPYAVRREVDDLEAVIDAAGGAAFVSSISSGAALSLLAAAELGQKVRKLALYEPPYEPGTADALRMRRFKKELDTVLAAGKRDDAVRLFMLFMGVPLEELDGIARHPQWSAWASVAPTLAHEVAIVGDGSVPVDVAARVSVPTLVLYGAASSPSMRAVADALVDVMPDARKRALENQMHEVSPEALGPVLVEFFESN